MITFGDMSSDLYSSIVYLQLSSAVMDTKRLEREILSLTERNRDLEAQLTRTKKLETDLAAAEARGDKLAGEVNHAQSKAESLGRDLKKVMRENAQSLSEFEKALIRKSEECNVSRLFVCEQHAFCC